jgi:hypothetical protein
MFTALVIISASEFCSHGEIPSSFRLYSILSSIIPALHQFGSIEVDHFLEFVSSHMVPHHDTHGSTAWFHCISLGTVVADFLYVGMGHASTNIAAVKKFYFLIIWLDSTVELCFKSLICSLFFLSAGS